MKLLLKKGQDKNILGGVSFVLEAKVELTPEEMNLVKENKAYREILLVKQVKIPYSSGIISMDISVSSLMEGQQFRCKDIGEILATEDNIKESCIHFRKVLTAIKNFNKEETFEY
ncbi:MAG: hypothetical protein Q8880_09350 [Bacteroidota bacterium]|nr:hypothetical protein [Bacteroidota bacterium]